MNKMLEFLWKEEKPLIVLVVLVVLFVIVTLIWGTPNANGCCCNCC